MTTRIRFVGDAESRPRVDRAKARDGWRRFQSKRDGFEIAVPVYQLRRVEAIGSREPDEWHALAMGEIFRDDHGTHAVLRDFVPNEWAERGRAHVKMSATAEARVRELTENLHPTLRPIGIIHTHPHFTTRPSGTDRKEFWSDPYAVSIILDPFDHPTVAVYRGPDGEKLVEVTDEGDDAVQRERDVVPLSELPTSQRKRVPNRPRWGAFALALLAVVLAAGGVCIASLVSLTRASARTEESLRNVAARVEHLEVEASRAALAPPAEPSAPEPLDCRSPEL